MGKPSSRVDQYRTELRALPALGWERYLTDNSRLPGPRGNIELAMAFAEEASARLIHRLSKSPDEFLAACGVIGLGRLAAEGKPNALALMHGHASDGRWRVREGVAMGLQRLGDADLPQMTKVARKWVNDPDWLVQRAAIAGICEPRHLSGPSVGRQALTVVDIATRNIAAAPAIQKKTPGFRALRQALGYCWSVAIAAAPDTGFDRLEAWADSVDVDVRWVVRTNLTKKRLQSADKGRWKALGERVAT